MKKIILSILFLLTFFLFLSFFFIISNNNTHLTSDKNFNNILEEYSNWLNYLINEIYNLNSNSLVDLKPLPVKDKY